MANGLGRELTALYAFLAGEREQEMCFLPGNDRSVILFDPANLESSATTRRINDHRVNTKKGNAHKQETTINIRHLRAR